MRISGITYAHRRTNRVRNMVWTLILILIISSILLTLYSAYVGWNLTHPGRKSIPAFTANTVPEYKEAEFTDIKKQVKLKGWYFESKGSVKTVILSHGYGESRLQFGEKTLDMVKSFLSKGYGVLLFDFRNSGISSGKITSVGIYEQDDLLGAVKYVKAQGAKQVSVIGFSMGASVAIASAAESGDIDAVIADSPFSDLNEYLNDNLPKWSNLPAFPFNKTILVSTKFMTGIDPLRFSPKTVIAKISPRPILFIHSKDDIKIPISNSRELYDAYAGVHGSKAEFWETQSADHVGSYNKNPEEYMDRVIKFLDKVNVNAK